MSGEVRGLVCGPVGAAQVEESVWWSRVTCRQTVTQQVSVSNLCGCFAFKINLWHTPAFKKRKKRFSAGVLKIKLIIWGNRYSSEVCQCCSNTFLSTTFIAILILNELLL